MPRHPRQLTDLEDPGHLAHQRHEWLIERVGWWIMLAIVLAALLGYLGPGPLTDFQAASPDGDLTVEYHGVERYAAPGEIRFHFGPRERQSDTVRLLVHRQFIDATTQQQFTPQPRATEASGQWLVYSFDIADLLGDERVVYRYQHEDFGRFERRFAVQDRQPVEFVQWVLP